MASGKPKAIVPVPVQGLREDIDISVSTTEMVVEGVNVISIDQTLRPRPCNRLLEFNTGQGIAWEAKHDGTLQAVGIIGTKTILGQVYSSGSWSLTGSNDDGDNWSSLGSGGAISSVRIAAFIQTGSYVWAIPYEGFKIYVADLTAWTWPNSISFALHDDYLATQGISDWYGWIKTAQPIYYDGDANVLYYLLDGYTLGGGIGELRKFLMAVRAPNSAGATDLEVFPLSMPTGDGYSQYDFNIIATQNSKLWVAWYRKEFGGGGTAICSYSSVRGAPIVDQYDPYDVDCDVISGASNFAGDKIRVLGKNKIRTLDPVAGTIVNSLSAPSAEFEFLVANTNFEVAVGAECYYTDDGWATSTQVQTLPTSDLTNVIVADGGALEGGWSFHAGDPDTGLGELFFLADADAANNTGESTSLFQIDLDIDAYSVFLGTTRTVLRLNRSTAAWDDIGPATKFTGSRESNPVVFRSFDSAGETWILATNGKDQPVHWNENLVSGIFEEIDDGAADKPPVSRCMAVSARRVIFAGLSGEPYGVTFSALNDQTTGWNLSSTGSKWTTYALLGDTPGAIVSLNEISALVVAVYKEDAIYHAIAQAQFLNTEAPFRFELAKSGIVGPASQMSITRLLDGRQAYLGLDGGVYIYDGVQPTDCGRHIRTAIQKDIDEYHIGLSWAMVDPYRKLLWIFYPTGNGATNRGIALQIDQPPPWPAWRVSFPYGWNMATGGRIFDFQDKTIGEFSERIGEVDVPLGSFSSGRYDMTIIRANNTLYRQKWTDDGDYTDGGIDIDIISRQGWESLGDPWQYATVHECQHMISSPDPTFEIGFKIIAQGATVDAIEEDSIEFIGPNTPRMKTSHRITGTRFSPMLTGSIHRLFNWGGCGMYHSVRGMK